MTKIIKTARLEIRPFGEDDLLSLAEILTNNEIKKTFMIPDFGTEEEITNMVEKLRKFSFSDAHFERGIYLDNSLIGFINDVEIDNDVIEIGYVIHPSFHNKGYATEMLKAVIEELLSNQYSTVIAGAFVENKASIRVMQKCGMEKISKEEDITYHSTKHHCIYYVARSI